MFLLLLFLQCLVQRREGKAKKRRLDLLSGSFGIGRARAPAICLYIGFFVQRNASWVCVCECGVCQERGWLCFIKGEQIWKDKIWRVGGDAHFHILISVKFVIDMQSQINFDIKS